MRRTAAVALLGLVLAACAGDTPGDATTPSTAPGEATTTVPSAATTTTTVLGSTSTMPVATTTVPDPTVTTLAGEPIDIGPLEGDVLMVVGVAHDDVLNLRAGPGVDQEILAGLAPTEGEVVALGRSRKLPRSIWVEVEAVGEAGWVNLRYLGYEGATDDLTSATIDRLGGRPEADGMTELGRIVAEAWASEDPASDIVIVVAETLGDLGEVTYDVIGIGDDAVRGQRLHVFGGVESDVFSLRSVEGTVICARGVTSDGLCP